MISKRTFRIVKKQNYRQTLMLTMQIFLCCNKPKNYRKFFCINNEIIYTYTYEIKNIYTQEDDGEKRTKRYTYLK